MLDELTRAFAWIAPALVRRGFRHRVARLGLAGRAAFVPGLVSLLLLATGQSSSASCAGQCPVHADLTLRAVPNMQVPSELGLRFHRPTIILVRLDARGHPISAALLISSGSPALDRAAKRAALDSGYSSAPSRCASTTRTFRFTQRWDIN